MKEMFSERLEFLQNNFYSYGEYALVGTKGYCYEGKDTIEHFEKLRSREIERLRVSLEMAKKAGYQKFTGMISTGMGRKKNFPLPLRGMERTIIIWSFMIIRSR